MTSTGTVPTTGPAPTRAPAPASQPLQRARWAVTDALTITKRDMMVWLRVPSFIVFAVIQPVMFVLLFRYVFGGAIPVRAQGGYVNYLLPGIIAQSAAFGSFSTAIALAREVQRGVIDRFRSMPMARSAVLVGRLLADAVRLTITVLIITGVGYAVGFRFEEGVAKAVLMLIIGVVLGVAVCCVAAFIGLALKDEESVGSFGLIWLFPLTFVSSAFVPVASMPGWLQAFANNQPVSVVINEMRHLAIGYPKTGQGWQSALWLLGFFVVFVPLAVRAYRRV